MRFFVQTPIRFDDYYLIERIAVGGMAEVFKGVSYGAEGFERLSAVKRVLPHIAEDKEFIEMFIDEAKIVAQLQHPNIGQVFHLGQDQGKYFIAMEYIPGQNLRSIFEKARRNQEPLDVGLCAYLIKEVCEALDYAHRKTNAKQEPLHLIHRDISPQNIILSYDGSVKLIDFGIAKAEGKRNQTQVGILKGKFSYMSPEQARGNPLDARSDLFALAIVLYELLTLERCFLGQSDFSTIERVRNLEYTSPRKIRRDLPPQLEKIVLKGLAKDPAMRFQSAADFQEALNRFIYTHYQGKSAKPVANRKAARTYMETRFQSEIQRENERLNDFRTYATKHIPEAQMASPATAKFSHAQLQEAISYNHEPRLSVNFKTDTLPLQNTTQSVSALAPSNLYSRISILILLALLTGTLTTVFLWISKAETGELYIKGDPSHEVQFTLDNGNMVEDGVIPARISMLPIGQYTLTLKSKIHHPFTTQVQIASNQVHRISPKLKLNPDLGEIRILSTPSQAEVLINGNVAGTTPLKITSKLGRLKIQLKLNDFYQKEDLIKVTNTIKDYSYLLYPKKIKLTLIPSVPNAKVYVKESEAIPWRLLGQGNQSLRVNNDGRVKIKVNAPGYLTEELHLSQSVQNELQEIISLTQDPKARSQEGFGTFSDQSQVSQLSSDLAPDEYNVSTQKGSTSETEQELEAARKKEARRKEAQKREARKREARRKAARKKAARKKAARKKAARKKAPPVEEDVEIQPGLLRLSASPQAEVFLGNKSLGWTPIIDRPLKPGVYNLKLVLATGVKYSVKVVMNSGVQTLKKWKKPR